MIPGDRVVLHVPLLAGGACVAVDAFGKAHNTAKSWLAMHFRSGLGFLL